MRSGGTAHKLGSAANLKGKRIFLLPHYRYPFTVEPFTDSFTDNEPWSDIRSCIGAYRFTARYHYYA